MKGYAPCFPSTDKTSTQNGGPTFQYARDIQEDGGSGGEEHNTSFQEPIPGKVKLFSLFWKVECYFDEHCKTHGKCRGTHNPHCTTRTDRFGLYMTLRSAVAETGQHSVPSPSGQKRFRVALHCHVFLFACRGGTR